MSILGSPVVRFLLAMLFALTAQAAPDSEALARGVALRNGGNLQQAIDYFRSLDTGEDRVAASGELGASLLQARRYDEAEAYLREAYARTAGSERARYAIELGNLAAARRRPAEALRFYAEAQTLAGGDSALALMARINEARLADRRERPTLLAAISRDLARVNIPLARARLRLSVGILASEVGSVQIAYENLDEARILAVQAGDVRVEVEALDGLAQLYERQGRYDEALRLSRRAITRAQTVDGIYADILLRLEWRQGRLLAAQGANEQARAAYLRAIAQVESIRQDIPIEYESGRSSFRDTLEPIYLGLIDLLLKKADAAEGSERVALLRRARDTGELIKQSELQDYLGERCSVDAAQNSTQAGVAAGTAIFYPIVLHDRIEVIFESGAGISRHTTNMDAQSLRKLVSSYAEKLRDGEPDYLDGAVKLYDILVRPFENEIIAQGVHTLLVVPDGVLRLLPWATLYDGQQFLVQKYALVINSGLSMTSQTATRGQVFTALVAGMAKPGPVVDRLSSSSLAQILDQPASRSALPLAQNRTLRKVSLSTRAARSAADMSIVKEQLALPGVKLEVDSLAKILPGTSLLDGTFTTARLSDEFAKGEYHIVHLATHGFFGSTADESFIMAYDNLVTMDGLQKLLQVEGVRRTPIELLTLSACETAEGDDRSPLGIAGAAIKAKARSVLGSLWPVSDEAAQLVMERFYQGIVRDGLSKAEALRRAQVVLIADPNLNHPFYWAPFILVGNWR
ncbi:conserved exported hypothetical protein [Candidatus Accumulibacter aalborgensis]|uniref:CHAT domain-containing protein n=1 Tax=Candidatus Accumulibacter aalborgensis TaxID=1860102 RepID=A0A1A8XFF2_9PROT|nr:CHAT domain-containing protein [Candidatus Accumulibacter aalborgensis]SBT03097.1 conserved exported hypothetical protein [Candidatus Accumulibacter aalborgensis]